MKQEKLEAILTTAKKMFARYGPRKTNLDEIARMAKVAKGTIYSYFGSKDRVYLEVLSQEADEVVKKISLSVGKEVSPEAKFAVFVRAKFQYMRHAVNILYLDREGIEKYSPAAESIRNDFLEQEIKIIDSILRQGMEKGVFRLNDVSLAARAIAHALRGFELNWLVQEGEETIERYLDELLNLLFFGLMVEKKVG
ncbi:MAG: TetR/AcrR family transcriptional regulator [Syntrophales bacterium]|nr:TetR/AcrR family transcriptional regulator [Syntrophales bacterium]